MIEKIRSRVSFMADAVLEGQLSAIERKIASGKYGEESEENAQLAEAKQYLDLLQSEKAKRDAKKPVQEEG